MAKTIEMSRCRYVMDASERPPVHFGFGVVFHYNDKAELFTIINDGGEVVQKGDGLVYFPENKVK